MRNKKRLNKSLETILILLLVISLAAIMFIEFKSTFSVAFADSDSYIQASVSDLKGNEYAQKSSVLISTDEDSFYIPESYFVKIGSKAFENTYNAIYMDEHCYITLEENTSLVSTSSSSLYPNVSLTIKDGESVTLNSVTLTSDYTILLMGYSEDSSKLYVKATKDSSKLMGFIDASKVNAFNVPYETSTQEERNNILAEEEFDPNEELPNSTSKGIRIAIIVCLAVAALIITAFIFVKRPSKSQPIVKEVDTEGYDETKEV